MNERMERLFTFLKPWVKENDAWGDNNMQTFTTRNLVGDSMRTIYDQDGITVDHCNFWSYIEVFGLNKDEEKLLFEQEFIY